MSPEPRDPVAGKASMHGGLRLPMAARTLAGPLRAPLAPLGAAVGLPSLRLAVAIGQALDHLFFPSIRSADVDRPLLLVGPPRTGTTFLHRWLTDSGAVVGGQLWQHILPSATLQTVLRPAVPLLEKFSPTRHHDKAAHDTSLQGVETDDSALTVHFADGFFLYAFVLAFHPIEMRALFDPENRDTTARDVAWLRTCWRRTLARSAANRPVGKAFSFGARLPSVLRELPGARCVYTLRDPRDSIPSTFSLVSGVLEGRFRLSRLPEETRQRWHARLYEALVLLWTRFARHHREGLLPADRVLVLPYTDLISDFERAAARIAEFADLDVPDDFGARAKATAEKQRAYRSAHRYDFASYGLDPVRIREDFAEVYDLMDALG